MINIANQDLVGRKYITLENYAFAGCCEDDVTDRPHNAPLIMSMNRIPVIPAYAFVGLNQVYIDLNHIGVEHVRINAFEGASNISVDLRGNNIRKMSSSSFGSSLLNNSRSSCTDFVGFTVSFSVLPDYENTYVSYS